MFPKMSESSQGPSLEPRLGSPYLGGGVCSRVPARLQTQTRVQMLPSSVLPGSGLAQGLEGQPTSWISSAQQSGAAKRGPEAASVFLPCPPSSARRCWWSLPEPKAIAVEACDRTCLITPSYAIKGRFTLWGNPRPSVKSCLSAPRNQVP